MTMNMTKTSSRISGWSNLPEELVHTISKKLEDCVDVIHARSVCAWWRTTFPFPACLSRETHTLPSISGKDKACCILEKFSSFLIRVPPLPVPPVALCSLPVRAAPPCELLLGKIRQDDSEKDSTKLPSPLQCSLKVEVLDTVRTSFNMLDCKILPLGDQYSLTFCGWHLEGYNGMACLPLKREGEKEEFVVIVSYVSGLLVLTSADMRWQLLKNVPIHLCSSLATFRGRFHATFLDGSSVSIDPYSLAVIPLMPSLDTPNDLVPCGNDELYLVETEPIRVSRLDEEAHTWVRVKDLGERVLVINACFGNVSFSTKELPHGCGLSGDFILFIPDEANATIRLHKFETRDLSDGWRRMKRMTMLTSSSILTLHATC